MDVDPTYADAEDTKVAYWVLGDPAALDIFVVAGAFFPVEALLDDPVSNRFLDGLSALGRVIVFDKRGVGLSDPITDWDTPPRVQWAEDLRAVSAAVGSGARRAIVSWDTLGVARTAAAGDRSLADALVLINPSPDLEGLLGLWDRTGTTSGQPTSSVESLVLPSRIDEPGFQNWLERAGRTGASPSMASRIWSSTLSDTADFTPDGIECPTLLLHRTGSMLPRRDVDRVAAAIDDSVIVPIEGVDLYPVAGDPDPLLVEIARFLGVDRPLPAPERSICAVLFTDIVESTVTAVETGDASWKRMLDEHDAVVRGAVERAGGEVVKFTGDGVLALLPSASAALGAADSMSTSLARGGVAIRTGIHVGDVERRGDDVSGLTVHIASRVMANAGAHEVLVTDSVRRATLGGDVSYQHRGAVELRGIPEQWDLYILQSE